MRKIVNSYILIVMFVLVSPNLWGRAYLTSYSQIRLGEDDVQYLLSFHQEDLSFYTSLSGQDDWSIPRWIDYLKESNKDLKQWFHDKLYLQVDGKRVDFSHFEIFSTIPHYLTVRYIFPVNKEAREDFILYYLFPSHPLKKERTFLEVVDEFGQRKGDVILHDEYRGAEWSEQKIQAKKIEKGKLLQGKEGTLPLIIIAFFAVLLLFYQVRR